MNADPLPADPANLHPHPPVAVIFKRSMLSRIADRNPFFLVSAVCMLWGCLSLTNSSSWNSLPLPRLLLLIGTLNVYEVTLIGLSILLLRRGLLRDGKILLILEAFFLVDVAFLNAEVVTANLRVGMAVNAVLLLLAAVKLFAIARGLRDSISPARMTFVLTQMTVLLALPCYFRHVDQGALQPSLFYAAWWLVGLMPAVGLIIRRIVAGIRSENASTISGLPGLFLVLPWISLIAHLGILHYAYNVEYLPAMAAPLLLGIAIGLSRVTPMPMLPRKEIVGMQLLLPLLAVCVSVHAPTDLNVLLLGKPSLAISPLVMALAGAYGTIVYCFLWQYAALLVSAGVAVAAGVVFGPTIEEIRYAFWFVWDWSFDSTNRIVPKTATQWGIVSVVASFFFLALGAAISFHRTPGDHVS